MKIDGNKVLLVGNRGHKNMGDELILVGNIKYLLKQGKKLVIACSNKDWLKSFHKQFLEQKSSEVEEFIERTQKEEVGMYHTFDLAENDKGFYDKKSGEQIITYVQELPKGFRSTLKFLKDFKLWKDLFSVDSVLIGGGEIFTEETPFSYWYWVASVWPFLLTKNIYLSGGIQIPKKIRNKIPFKILTGVAKKLYVRDKDLFEKLDKNDRLVKKLEFFPDTSLFVCDFVDLTNYKWLINFSGDEKIIDKDKDGYLVEIEANKVSTPFIVINLNKKAEKFYDEVYKIVDSYYRQDYEVYFVPVCKSPTDMDIVYYHRLKEKIPALKLLDWENWYDFIKRLQQADKVFTTRLHLFLISYYLGCDVQPFVYQKKVEKMKKVLNL